MAKEGKTEDETFVINDQDHKNASKAKQQENKSMPKKKYSIKVGAINNNDVFICTNDINSANVIVEWYKSETGRKVDDYKPNKFLKGAYILEGARKYSAFGDHWDILMTDKLMEVGYKLSNVRRGVQYGECFLFISDFENS